jgi:hypothetical protein
MVVRSSSGRSNGLHDTSAASDDPTWDCLRVLQATIQETEEVPGLCGSVSVERRKVSTSKPAGRYFGLTLGHAYIELVRCAYPEYLYRPTCIHLQGRGRDQTRPCAAVNPRWMGRASIDCHSARGELKPAETLLGTHLPPSRVCQKCFSRRRRAYTVSLMYRLWYRRGRPCRIVLYY